MWKRKPKTEMVMPVEPIGPSFYWQYRILRGGAEDVNEAMANLEEVIAQSRLDNSFGHDFIGGVSAVYDGSRWNVFQAVRVFIRR